MRSRSIILLLSSTLMFTNCSDGRMEEKGFEVHPPGGSEDTTQTDGLSRDSLRFDTRPSNVLLTGIPHIRLTTVYKVNRRKDDGRSFIGSNNFHYRYEEDGTDPRNNWNSHIMPGIEALYGYNLVNISHYDLLADTQRLFFDKPVLIKTLYYPSFSQDTLNNIPVQREFFLVTAYDEDTNKDGYVNVGDLRRIHVFGPNGERRKTPVPKNYSVIKSEYDPANDLMFVFAQLDANGNGRRDEEEPIHVHWIDLKDPSRTGRSY